MKYQYFDEKYDEYLSHADIQITKDMKYGLPDKKKYPMPDRDHVLSAIKFFNYVSPKDESELAKHILARMEEYGIDEVNVGPDNRFGKYYKKTELKHHQIKGAKHGVRRWQNEDGSWTPEGRLRYGKGGAPRGSYKDIESRNKDRLIKRMASVNKDAYGNLRTKEGTIRVLQQDNLVQGFADKLQNKYSDLVFAENKLAALKENILQSTKFKEYEKAYYKRNDINLKKDAGIIGDRKEFRNSHVFSEYLEDSGEKALFDKVRDECLNATKTYDNAFKRIRETYLGEAAKETVHFKQDKGREQECSKALLLRSAVEDLNIKNHDNNVEFEEVPMNVGGEKNLLVGTLKDYYRPNKLFSKDFDGEDATVKEIKSSKNSVNKANLGTLMNKITDASVTGDDKKIRQYIKEAQDYLNKENSRLSGADFDGDKSITFNKKDIVKVPKMKTESDKRKFAMRIVDDMIKDAGANISKGSDTYKELVEEELKYIY